MSIGRQYTLSLYFLTLSKIRCTNYDAMRDKGVFFGPRQALTESRVKTEFYKTPHGKKASEKMPKLAFIAGQIGLQKAQAHQTDLQQMIEQQKGKQGGGG